MRLRAAMTGLTLLGGIAFLSGCCHTVNVPRLRFERLEMKLWPAEPVFSGPGSAGPIWSTPSISSPCSPCGPCGSGGCCPPATPLQPIDPFGWLSQGSAGTQIVDPVGWVFGI